MEACLQRIEAFDDVYMAFNTVRFEDALNEARALEGRSPTGPLFGVPLVMKDNYYTAGVATTANSRQVAPNWPLSAGRH